MKMKTKISGVGTGLLCESLGIDWMRNPKSHLFSFVGAIAMNFSAFPLRTICKQMDFLIVWSSCISFYLEKSEFSVCVLFINCWQLWFFIYYYWCCLFEVINSCSFNGSLDLWGRKIMNSEYRILNHRFLCK